jgi:pimeloyl-ACP methyl ester carboxylesterase
MHDRRIVDKTHWKSDTKMGHTKLVKRLARSSRGGGRPDLAGDALPKVKSPTLLIVGGLDYPMIKMNENPYRQLRCEKELKIVSGATHLFEEPGTLEEVARLAADWV